MSNKEVEVYDISDSTSLQVAITEALNADPKEVTPDEDTDEEESEDNTDEESNDTTETTRVVKDDTPEIYYFEQNNITRDITFDPQQPDSEGDKGFPVRARGQIDSIIVESQSDDFRLAVRVDDDNIVDDKHFTNLQSISQELAHIGAYQKSNGNYVFSLADYTFRDELRFSIIPNGSITFDLIRVELMLDEFDRSLQ